jgi:hypothetical protein
MRRIFASTFVTLLLPTSAMAQTTTDPAAPAAPGAPTPAPEGSDFGDWWWLIIVVALIAAGIWYMQKRKPTGRI